ncbi:phage resistance protein [Nocardioides sp. GY 10127]|uniref:phage resistance protein n=1 Tax=Nocardioides sp. GY 10127 TaxID=2569762 RepID=UPI001458E98B|nr:phage resistance protein [Nocardioides sp. GY 10127]
MTMLRDVITIPERLSASDFVVGLAEGVAARESTLSTYVVTPQLAEAFDQALGLVAGALSSRRSAAAFLHGSFGSGKSHFMAVLHLLLAHDADARAVPELAPVVAKHDAVLSGTTVLPLDFHMIGAESLEAAILGGYVKQVAATHPDAPLPAVHRSDALLDNADSTRRNLGDEAFLRVLNAGASPAEPAGGGIFGDLGLATGVGGGSAWSAETYDAARRQPQGHPDRDRLVSDLVRTHFPAFTSSTEYVDLDTGLAVVSRHAQQLGADVVVLFLDELILWLASHLGDREFVTNEGAKLAKLVESQDASRAIPLVSLIARQRDITEFLGEHVPGAERAAFRDVFGWSRGRFDDVRLEDRNLPVIAQKRLLRPKNAAAGAVLDAAFAEVDRRPEVWDVLLTGGQVEGGGTGSDQAAFRATYPFSPALLSTLVALSQVLQRERTALKVMLQLLVEGRDELQVNDLVPVGDLFDVLVTSDVEAVTGELKHQFETARRLYTTKIRQALLDRHQLTDAQARDLPRDHAFVTDDRLAKTVLLSALAPDVPALANLTAERLAALNHGTISTWIPGEEVAVVLQGMKDLAAAVGEVTVSEDDDPRISVELTDVDHESVLERARNVDNEGNRKVMLRRLVWEQLKVVEESTIDGAQSQQVVWRGRRTALDLVFGNVRDTTEMPDSVLMAEGGRWKVVVDYPFDTQGQNPRSDQARVEGLQGRGVRSQTLFWVPAFLTEQRMKDLGTLVVLEHVLAGQGDRFHQYAAHLSPVDREQARNLLTQRRSLLRERLVGCLRQAYGVAARQEADIDDSSALASPFLTLEEGFRPVPPVGATLADALRHLADQAFSHTWPKHPRFEPGDVEVKVGDVRKLLEACREAVTQPAGRLSLEQPQRAPFRRICGPLEVGQVHENHLLLDTTTFPWARRFDQAAAREGLGDALPVARLLAWLDEPEARGLDRALAGLVVHVHALLADLAWYRDGVPVAAPDVDQVSAAHELRRPVRLPDDVWSAAARAGREVLGLSVTDLQTSENVARLVAGARAAVTQHQAAVSALHRALLEHEAALGARPDPWPRLVTADEVGTLLARLGEASDADVPTVLAAAAWTSSAAAARRSMEQAGAVTRVLEQAQWHVFVSLGAITDERADRARDVLGRARDLLAHDELAASVVTGLAALDREAVRLLTTAPPPPVTPPGPPVSPPVTPPVPPRPGAQVREVDADSVERVLDEIRAALGDGRLRITWEPTE